jgi:hypothetical protein
MLATSFSILLAALTPLAIGLLSRRTTDVVPSGGFDVRGWVLLNEPLIGLLS